MQNNIPKIVHVTWKHKNILKNKSPLITNGICNLIKLNPEWKVTVYDDKDIDDYLKFNLDSLDYQIIKYKHPVEKSDIWRLIKLYQEGGMYVDIDRLCNKNIDYLLKESVKWVLPICKNYDFSHDIMISSPNNPVFLEAIYLYLQRRREGSTNVYYLGAQTYMHAITKQLFGEIINTNPGVEKFNWMKEEIKKISFINLFVENPPYDTILYSGTDIEFDHETIKRELYKANNIKHWTGNW